MYDNFFYNFITSISGTFATALVGIFVTLMLLIYTHWVFGLASTILTVVATIANYMAFKK